ncbi:hypothetical protein Ahy_A06g030795 [Arachis hypogaea]|uniref:Uncharacterized protein n=1 Tax=Arachis hypogaea TaxID=3818 RepID=A0A445CXB2_ARAHY|nr:hypothetical protein Ahy_A06g030795 [Arachis hypogaea]
MPIWTGDEDYEKFEVHGHPTNMTMHLLILDADWHSLCSCLCCPCKGKQEVGRLLSPTVYYGGIQ